jgi:hypothetical protein
MKCFKFEPGDFNFCKLDNSSDAADSSGYYVLRVKSENPSRTLSIMKTALMACEKHRESGETYTQLASKISHMSNAYADISRIEIVDDEVLIVTMYRLGADFPFTLMSTYLELMCVCVNRNLSMYMYELNATYYDYPEINIEDLIESCGMKFYYD